jgi:hypothetical protein
MKNHATHKRNSLRVFDARAETLKRVQIATVACLSNERPLAKEIGRLADRTHHWQTKQQTANQCSRLTNHTACGFRRRLFGNPSPIKKRQPHVY